MGHTPLCIRDPRLFSDFPVAGIETYSPTRAKAAHYHWYGGYAFASKAISIAFDELYYLPASSCDLRRVAADLQSLREPRHCHVLTPFTFKPDL